MAKDPIGSIEHILVEADALIRLRLKAIGIEANHVILALMPDGTGIVRSKVGPGGLTPMADILKDIADQTESPPTDDDTQH
jgi:hypothetical protein